jgi:ankyrin repeat protein
MSVPSHLEFLRKEAKALLKKCRSGDADAIRRVRLQLPRLASLTDVQLAEAVKLADIHHAVARERGHDSWGELKRGDSLVEQFLVAIRGADFREARRTLAALPEMAAESLHAACAIGDSEAVAHHLDRDPSLLNAEHGGWAPLMYACGSLLSRVSARQSAGILECATLLLDRGADPNTFVLTDPSDPQSALSAFRRAMSCGNMPIAMRLMQRGVKPDFQKWLSAARQQQPVMSEAFREYFGSPEVRLQFENRMEAIRQEQGQGPLWGSEKWWFHTRAAPPMMALEMFRPMLERRALDPNKTGIDGYSMFHRAAQNGTPDVLRLFVDHGANLEHRTPDGKTALVLAVREGRNLNVDILRARGATSAGLRPIDELVGACVRADEAGAQSVLKIHPQVLSQASLEDAEVLVRAAATNILDRVRLMLSCGFDPGAFGEGGLTPLHAAAWHGHVEMVRLLLGFHAPVNSPDATFGSSPLAWADHGSRHRQDAEKDYRAIVNALVGAGAV